jgi:hypothetical protein
MSLLLTLTILFAFDFGTSSAGPSPSCIAALEARCRQSRGTAACSLCAGKQQRELRAAGCTNADVAAFCQGATTTVRVRALQDGLPPVAPNFVGLSIEVGAVLSMIGEMGASAPLATVLGHLYQLTAGPHPGPTLRLGGNSADNSAWMAEPADPLPKGITYAITAKDLSAYATFASRTAREKANVTFIIDTNFGTSPDPQRFGVPHVQAVVTHPGLLQYVSAVEIGNEIDLFHDQSSQKPGRPLHRNASYTEREYEVEWGEFIRAFEAPTAAGGGGLPQGLIQAATYASANGEWGRRLGALTQQWAPHLGSLSLHRYATSTCHGRVVTAADLLSDVATRGKVDAYRRHITASNSAGVPFVIGEGNTASCGGQQGVSDTLAAALWSLDFLPTLSKAGCHRMNFHGGPRGAYPPISFLAGSGQLQVRPLYYGLYLFSQLVANHSRWLSTHVSGAGMLPGPSPSSDPLCGHGLRQGAICCARRCGKCGGPGCNEQPGGAADCCAGTIQTANLSCTDHVAPCMVAATSATTPIISHATISAHHTRVLVVRKTGGGGAMPVQVCADPASLGFAWAAANGSTAELVELQGSMGLATTATHGDLTLGGRTLKGSLDGEWKGAAASRTVVSRAGEGDEVCFDLRMEPYSAAMLVLRIARQA